MKMKKEPSALVMGLVNEFWENQPPLSEKLKAECNSYYGFAAPKGEWGQLLPFLTPALLSEALAVSIKTLERLRNEGSGPAYIKVGKQIRYPIVELDNWVREVLIYGEALGPAESE
jgi:hypothetical protein